MSDSESGAALVIVLLFAALLAALAGFAFRGTSSGVRAAAVFLDATRADELGRGAADAVGAWIQGRGSSAQRGGAFAFHLDQADIEVEYRSESARVDLNKAPPDLIAAVLSAAGADQDQVTAIRNRIAGERGDTPAGSRLLAIRVASDAPDATASPGPPVPRGARLIEAPAEAVERWNLPGAIAARALDAFTVANGTPTVDPVLAGRLVLAALLGDDARVDDYRERRSHGFTNTGSALALLPVDAQAFAGFADVSAVRALVRVTIAHRFKRRYEIVLDPPAFAGQAPNVLSWRPLF